MYQRGFIAAISGRYLVFATKTDFLLNSQNCCMKLPCYVPNKRFIDESFCCAEVAIISEREIMDVACGILWKEIIPQAP